MVAVFLDRIGVAMIYQNFDLEIIRPYGSERLCARVLESPQGDCPFVDVKWPFNAEEESMMLSEIYGGLRQRRGRSSQANTIEDFGGKLFEAVFSGDIEHLFRSSLDSAFRSGKGLRVRLRLPEDSELHVRPWEFLFDTESREFLAVREHTPLVRYLPVAQPIPPIMVEGPLRVLVALSSPTDHPRLDIAREWEILRNALEPSIAAGQLELRRVPSRCTFDNLRDSLRHYGAHIFHFVGHGIPGALVLEQDSGRGQEMEATHLRSAFPSGALPRLIVLNSCSGAITQDVPFSGLAQGFLRQGVPAVVAMQASITDNAALIFTRYFYRDLVEIGAVDTSLTEARLRMQANGHPIEWGTPVLYMRALSGQLFQPVAKPLASPAGAKKKEAAAKTSARPERVAPVSSEQKAGQASQSQQGALPLQASPGAVARKRTKTTRPRENVPPAGPQAEEPTTPLKPEPAARDIPPETPAKEAVSPLDFGPVPPEAAADPAGQVLPPKFPTKRRTPPSKREPNLDVDATVPNVQPGELPPVFILEPQAQQEQEVVPDDGAPSQPAPPVQAETPAPFPPPSRRGVFAAGSVAAALAVAIGAGSIWPSRDSPAPGKAAPSAAETRPAPAAEPHTTPAPAPDPVVPRMASGSGEDVIQRPNARAKAPEKAAKSSVPAPRKTRPASKAASPAPADNCTSPEISERSVNCVFRDQ